MTPRLTAQAPRSSSPLLMPGWPAAAGTGTSCDFRLMSRTTYAAQPDVTVGILAGGGGTQRMPRLIGIDKALEIQSTWASCLRREAERIGLRTRACHPHRVLPEAIAFAKRIAAQRPLAVANSGRQFTRDESLSCRRSGARGQTLQ